MATNQFDLPIDLGPIVKVYETPRAAHLRLGVLFMLAPLIFIAIVGFFLSSWESLNLYGRALGIVFAVFAVLISYISFSVWHPQRITYAQDGLYYQQGKERHTIKWADILYLYRKLTQDSAGQRFEWILHLRNNQMLTLDKATTETSDLIDKLQEQIVQTYLSEALTAYQSGKPFQYGHLKIERSGLSYADKRIAWQDIAQVSLEKDQLYIAQQPMQTLWAVIDMFYVPNARLCHRLLDVIVQMRMY
jgi:hypothetical protein